MLRLCTDSENHTKWQGNQVKYTTDKEQLSRGKRLYDDKLPTAISRRHVWLGCVCAKRQPCIYEAGPASKRLQHTAEHSNTHKSQSHVYLKYLRSTC